MITYDALQTLTSQILRGLGYPEKAADLTARVLIEADARGVASHGVARLAFYESNLKGGVVDLGAKPEIVHETPLSLVVDGHGAVGPIVSRFAMDRCLEKARAVGAGFASVRNSNHYGMAGLWAEEAATEGMIGLSFTNTRSCAIVTFGKRSLMGTNPIAVAIPTGGDPFLLDMATTTVAHGKIEVCDRRDKAMPLGWAVDEEGRGTTDAHLVVDHFHKGMPYGGQLYLGGEGELLGGHKGYGLALLVELLCAGLSLGSWSPRIYGERGTENGIAHFFGVLRLDLFGEKDLIERHVAAILDEIRQSEKAEGESRIYIHGEKERENRRQALEKGINLDEATQDLLTRYCQRFALACPSF